MILRICRAVGSSNVYVDVSGLAPRTLYCPMNLGQSFLALPVDNFNFFVERNTRVPFLMSGSGPQDQFALRVWKTHASMIALCTSARFSSARSAKSLMPLGIMSSGRISWIMEGMYPLFSSKGTYRVVPDTLTLIANSIRSTWSIQSFWSGHTTMWNIWPMLWLACSV